MKSLWELALMSLLIIVIFYIIGSGLLVLTDLYLDFNR